DAEPKRGKLAEQIGRARIVISDKSRVYDGNDLYQAVLTSCENLGACPDLYFVHQVDEEHEEEVFRRGGALDALAELKAEGRIRFAGIASHYYDTLLRGVRDSRVDVLQGSGNLLERGMLERIAEEPLFRAKGFLVNKVYAAGLLPAFFPASVLIGAVLSYPVSSALIGLGTVAQVDEAMKKEPDRNAPPSFDEVLSVLGKTYDPIPCSRCQRCKCPYGTEIHTLFRQYQYFFMGKDYWALKKLGLGIRESAAHCRGCTEMPCLEMCPAGIRIPDEIGRVEKLVLEMS
ncbi:MAG: aldo/keto reductase, partial [Lachnospiraceae bacterium]|nr:aldo/keto reductase [Lachnospiraceae bacterium]